MAHNSQVKPINQNIYKITIQFSLIVHQMPTPIFPFCDVTSLSIISTTYISHVSVYISFWSVMFIRNPEDSWGRMEVTLSFKKDVDKTRTDKDVSYTTHYFPHKTWYYLGFGNTQMEFSPVILHNVIKFDQYLQYSSVNFHKNSI